MTGSKFKFSRSTMLLVFLGLSIALDLPGLITFQRSWIGSTVFLFFFSAVAMARFTDLGLGNQRGLLTWWGCVAIGTILILGDFEKIGWVLMCAGGCVLMIIGTNTKDVGIHTDRLGIVLLGVCAISVMGVLAFFNFPSIWLFVVAQAYGLLDSMILPVRDFVFEKLPNDWSYEIRRNLLACLPFLLPICLFMVLAQNNLLGASFAGFGLSTVFGILIMPWLYKSREGTVSWYSWLGVGITLISVFPLLS